MNKISLLSVLRQRHRGTLTTICHCRYLLKRKQTTMFAETILTTHPTSSMVCQKQPVGVQTNCCFLVNIKKLKDPADIRADDLGTWKHNGRRTSYVKVLRDNDGKIVEVTKLLNRQNFPTDKIVELTKLLN